MVASVRQARCGFCLGIFSICRPCDRGQLYCSPRCRREGRAVSRRRANRRHQQTDEGRLDHRDRQRRWRDKRRIGRSAARGGGAAAANVTDNGSPVGASCGTDATGPSVPVTSAGPHEAEEMPLHVDPPSNLDPCAPVAAPVCAFCGYTALYVHFEPFARRSPRPTRRSLRDDRKRNRGRRDSPPALL